MLKIQSEMRTGDVNYLNIVSAKDKEGSFEEEDSAEILGKELSCRFFICFMITMNGPSLEIEQKTIINAINYYYADSIQKYRTLVCKKIE